MKYLVILFILLLSFTLVSASICSVECESEDYDSGVCREADEDREAFCEEDETMTGSFDLCTEGSLERCCCSSEDEVTIEPVEEEEEITEEITDRNYLINVPDIDIEKEDLPIIIFFELLVIVAILTIFASFKKPKNDEFL